MDYFFFLLIQQLERSKADRTASISIRMPNVNVIVLCLAFH